MKLGRARVTIRYDFLHVVRLVALKYVDVDAATFVSHAWGTVIVAKALFVGEGRCSLS